MAEYIEREALVYDFEHCGADSATINAIVYRINLHSAADVVPVVHGRWVEHYRTGIAFCSECDCDAVECGTNYCPNCGARMDGADE